MKKLLILGGFPQMIDIVFTAKAMGIYTIVTDRDPTSPAKCFADKAVNISTDRVDDLVDFCREEGVNGVFTGFEDFNIHIACELCARLDLSFYADKQQLEEITDKIRFKEKCRKYCVPIIKQYALTEAIGEGQYPYIVKPADSYGSRGITVCRNEEELRDGVRKAEFVSVSGRSIIERFLNSDHGCELFYTIVDSHIHLTVTADRYTVRNGETNVPLPVAEVFPSRHREALIRKVDPPVRNMLAGLGIHNGLVLIQMLWKNDDFFVYEMAYRLTGEQHYRIVEKQHGISLGEMMIRLSLGEDISAYDTSLLDDIEFVKPSINLSVLLMPGKIGKISGLERVYKIEEVISYILTHKEHDVISFSGDYSHILIRVNMVAENYKKLCIAVKLTNNYIHVEDEDGDNMIIDCFQLPEEI